MHAAQNSASRSPLCQCAKTTTDSATMVQGSGPASQSGIPRNNSASTRVKGCSRTQEMARVRGFASSLNQTKKSVTQVRNGRTHSCGQIDKASGAPVASTPTSNAKNTSGAAARIGAVASLPGAGKEAVLISVCLLEKGPQSGRLCAPRPGSDPPRRRYGRPHHFPKYGLPRRPAWSRRAAPAPGRHR